MCPKCESEYIDCEYWNGEIIYICLECMHEWEQDDED